jgi:hypothetical protein
LIYSFWVHFVTNTSLYFWNLRKILRLLIPINPTVYCEKIIFDPYVHLWGSVQGTKNVFKHILQTFATKWTISSLTVVLIPRSTHPIAHCVANVFHVETTWLPTINTYIHTKEVDINDNSVKQTKLFSCTQCSKPFVKKCDLNRHMRVHTGWKVLQLHCVWRIIC